jgi:hypothetical protein
MVCTPIYSYSALEGKYLEPCTSIHPIKAVGYEIHPDFISLVRELNFATGLNMSYPGSKSTEPKPPYVCPGCSNHTHGNNMINR